LFLLLRQIRTYGFLRAILEKLSMTACLDTPSIDAISEIQMLYGDDGSVRRIGGIPLDLLVYLLTHPEQEIRKKYLLSGAWHADGDACKSLKVMLDCASTARGA